MTTHNKMIRNMRAVARALQKFDLLEQGSKLEEYGYSYVCKPHNVATGEISYINSKGDMITSYPNKQGNPLVATISEMLRRSYLTRDKSRLYLTYEGKRQLIG